MCAIEKVVGQCRKGTGSSHKRKCVQTHSLIYLREDGYH